MLSSLASSKKSIKDDLTFGHIELKKDFLSFMQHCITRAEHYAYYEEPETLVQNPGKSRAY
jgi:hypothetical protein